MQPLSRTDLMSLEEYAVSRAQFRARVLSHKRDRKLALGEHVTLYFEDRLTIQYQIQEMLRVERIFEPVLIEEELSAYNPLVPEGRNWKATMMIEYGDVDERRAALEILVGIEHRVWLQVAGHSPVLAIADEDMDRATEEKTSAVHFMRFELSDAMAVAAKQGAVISAGIDHDAYPVKLDAVPEAVRQALITDLD